MIKVSFKKARKTRKDTFFYLILALMPILSLYEFIPLVNLGYGLVLIAICLKIVKENKNNIPVNLYFAMLMAIFFGINLIIGATKYSDFTNTLNNSLGMIVFTMLVIFICNPKILNIENLYKACRIIGVLSTVFLLYQFAAYYAFDWVVKGNISFLSVNDIGFRSIEYGRPTSFFLEPAHYALYISPIYAMSIIKKEYLTSFLLLMGLIFSTASTGIIMGIVLPIIIMFSNKNKNILRNILLIVVAVAALQLVTTLFFENILTKITFDSMFSSSRIFGTLYVLDYFEPIEWLFGIGINRMPDFLSAYMNTMIRNYSNSILFCIISFGLVGGIALIIYLYSLYKKTPVNYKVIWVILLLCLMSDQVLFNRNLLYLLIWQYATIESKGDKGKSSINFKDEVQYERTLGNGYNACL